MDEKTLLHHLTNSDGDDFDLLYAAYGHKIYHFAYRMTGEHKDAEDITQETFLQVYGPISYVIHLSPRYSLRRP